jgi:aminoglycoside phosphotransferase (APT) family kinase protein
MTTLSEDVLGEIVRAHRPALDAEPTFQPVPTGKFNTSYFVDADGEQMVLRIAPPRDAVFVFYERRMMRQEPEIHRLVREQTDAPVARIIAFDESHEIIPRDYLLMERLPGEPLTSRRGVDPDRALRQVGQHMAEVHDIVAEEYGYRGPHEVMEPQECWRDAFLMMWRRMINDVSMVGHYGEDEVRMLQKCGENHAEIFDYDGPARLLHMDIWHQNLLVDERGNLTGIVDWDRALWGDPEIEFAVLDYCGVSRPPFWEGYGAERDTSPRAQLRNAFYLLYELQKYIVIRQGRGNDPEAARAYKRQVMNFARDKIGF